MRPDEARLGARVRVQEGCEKAYLRGRVGTVAKTYATHDDRVALHVRFEDGLCGSCCGQTTWSGRMGPYGTGWGNGACGDAVAQGAAAGAPRASRTLG